MRTTIDIDDALLRRARKRAVKENRPFRRIVEESLRGYLDRKLRLSRYRLRWRTERGRIAPGAGLDNRSALTELMDGRA